MVRTKADNCARKAVAAKAPRKNLGVSSAVARAANAVKSPAGKGKFRGGNSICPRQTPDWQKEITNFMVSSPRSTAKQKENMDPDANEDEEPGCSKDDRNVEEIQGSSTGSSSRLQEEMSEEVENEEEEAAEEEEGEEDNDETEEAAGSSSTSSKPNFVRNNCISDSEDDD